MTSRHIRVAGLLVCLGMAGCSSSDQLARCPSVSILVDTASLPVLSADGKSVVYSVQMTSATRDCDMDKFKKNVAASVSLNFRALRAAAGPAASYTAPYFVAVSSEGHVLAKQLFAVQFSFPDGQRVAEFGDSVSSILVTPGRDKKPADYGILVGFQLTKAQLDYNRRMGRFAQ